MKLIAITGGIGAGKSVVSRILSSMGYDVYDTDSKAKTISQSSAVIARIFHHFGESVFIDGNLNRVKLAEIVFADKEKLSILNQIIHPAVIDDILAWKNNNLSEILFIETAILYQSGLNRHVEEVWEIVSPIETRIERVMLRNNISRQQVIERVNSQNHLPDPCEIIPPTFQIINDNHTPVLPQILKLLKSA